MKHTNNVTISLIKKTDHFLGHRLFDKLNNCETDKCSLESVRLSEKNKKFQFKTLLHVCIITEAITHWFYKVTISVKLQLRKA